MTHRLENAVGRLLTLPKDEQNHIAALMPAELDDEREWDRLFIESPDLLAELAAEAMAEHDAGLTRIIRVFTSGKLTRLCQSFRRG